MYGMVLMAALATAPETPSFGWGRGCTGCTGCTGVVLGCTGSCFGSCHGVGLFGIRARLAARWSCHGSCYGSCFGSSCMGSCFGSSCFGSSCTGSCFGSSCVGSMNPPGVYGPYGPQAGWAAHGVYHADPGAVPHGNPVTITRGPGSGCFGDSYLNTACYGSPIFINRSATLSGPTHYGHPMYSSTSFGYGVGYGSGPVFYGPDFQPPYGPCCEPGMGTIIQPAAPTPPQVRIDRSGYDAARAKPNAAPARLTVELPADAKLFVDGAVTKGEGNTRNFHTPDLPAGQTFYYELKAELVVDGKTVTEKKTVLVKAGDAISEGFPKLTAAANTPKTDAVAKK